MKTTKSSNFVRGHYRRGLTGKLIMVRPHARYHWLGRPKKSQAAA